MLQIYIFLIGWYLILFGSLAESTDKNKSSSATLLDKFQQHDYNISFERIERLHYDKRYIKFLDVITFKYNRTCPLVNATHMYNLDVGYNLEIVMQAYKFASNEYRTFPIRFEVNFCEAFDKNMMGIREFRKCGTFNGCPVEKNTTYIICNWAPNPTMFPPLIPSGQYMLEVQMMFRSIELYVLRGYATVFRPIKIPG